MAGTLWYTLCVSMFAAIGTFLFVDMLQPTLNPNGTDMSATGLRYWHCYNE